MFATGAGRQIEEKYIKTGLVRFGYQHFAFLGKPSLRAAEASECAATQGAFWPYHDRLFSMEPGEGSEAYARDVLGQIAADLQLDVSAFDACMDSGEYGAIVAAESSAAGSLGVRSTPTFLINGYPVTGALPFEEFEQLIEGALTAGARVTDGE